MKTNRLSILFVIITIFFCTAVLAQKESNPLILQEMSWVDVREYLKSSDMVIIPLGATEQHGPHLPLGTDFYEAMGMCRMISSQTRVVIASVLMAGYSHYHSGFPGTLSLSPETMETVLIETVEMLMKYGFRRFMFFNYHGGNNIVQERVIHRINHTTESMAIAIGHGGNLEKQEDEEFFDWHAGKGETSIMLYLKPELVRMDRAEKPEITFSPLMKKLQELGKKHPELMEVWSSLLGVPEDTLKGGASHELSSNGIWSFNNPGEATAEIGRQTVEHMVKTAVNFIKAWQQIKNR